MSSRTEQGAGPGPVRGTDRLLVLTYHSVSDEVTGPIGISPAIFAMQMRALAEAGYRSMTLADCIAWHGGREPAGRRVLITFDDAYDDFADNAVPLMREHGFSAINFVPSALVGSEARWLGSMRPPKRIMSLAQLRDLLDAGMEFGAHGRTHSDLTRLGPDERETEIVASRAELADGLGAEVTGFAAPYGAVDGAVVACIRSTYEAAFGVRLARAVRGDDLCDLPRIDMHYFRAERPWRDLLEGRLGYLRARTFGRAVRAGLMRFKPA